MGKTVTLRGEEVFSAGEYNGDAYSEDDLDEMVNAFQKLKGRLDPPLKLGHNDKQTMAKDMAREDGRPALGWVENLRRQGKKLMADFVQVPEKVADWIKEGRYRKKSAEIYWGFKDGGQTYKRALKAVALLGADTPANRDIASLSAQYDEHGNEYREVDYAMPMRKPGMPEDDEDMPMMPDEKKAEKPDRVATLEEVEQELAQFGERLAQATKGRVGAPAIRQFLSEIRTKMRGLMGGRRDNAEEGAEVRQHAEWSAAQINDLPDDAFAAIMPGGKKDEAGKTVPRSLRMLPHHGPGVKDPMDHESVDMPHLRNALARLEQADMPAAMKKRALAHLQAHAKERGMDGDMERMMEEVTKHMGELEDLTRKYTDLETQFKTFGEKLTAAETARTEAEKGKTDAEARAKEYADKLAAVETSLADEKKARRMSELKTVAAGFPHIPGSVEEKADKLFRLETADAKLYEERMAEWTALNAQLGEGDLFRQRSYSGQETPTGSAMQRFEAEVAKLTSQGKDLAEATKAVATTQPRLYSEYQREHARRAKGGD